MELGSSQHKKVELLSSDTSSTYPAHKAGCSPSWSLLGTDDEVNGGGTGMLMTAGQLFLNRHKPVVNYCAMVAIKVA